MTPLHIVHAAPRFVVVDKPAGLLSVPGKPRPGGPDNQDCVAARVRAMFPRSSGPLIVHRLDMETSGLMVLGLDPQAHRDLSRQFEERRTAKAYTALVATRPPAASGQITLPIRADIEDRPRQVVDIAQGRPALTEWSTADEAEGAFRLRIIPHTGRTHQIRLHLAHPLGLGSPILGDSLYGGPPAARLMLHAHSLSFADPDGGATVRVELAAPF